MRIRVSVYKFKFVLGFNFNYVSLLIGCLCAGGGAGSGAGGSACGGGGFDVLSPGVLGLLESGNGGILQLVQLVQFVRCRCLPCVAPGGSPGSLARWGWDCIGLAAWKAYKGFFRLCRLFLGCFLCSCLMF